MNTFCKLIAYSNMECRCYFLIFLAFIIKLHATAMEDNLFISQ